MATRREYTKDFFHGGDVSDSEVFEAVVGERGGGGAGGESEGEELGCYRGEFVDEVGEEGVGGGKMGVEMG